MGRREDVDTASGPIAFLAVAGLGAQLVNALASIPFRKPMRGPARPTLNLGVAVTRTVLRAFIGYTTSLPIPEFRSVEIVIDTICRWVLPPVVRRLGVTMRDTVVGGVPSLESRHAHDAPRGTILYLHGGGFIGTSPRMYSAFTAWIVRETGCRVIVPDYRLAPEFPFPASLIDTMSVYEALLAEGVPATQLFVAGDSAGGNLVTALLGEAERRHLPRPAGLILFSPELSLALDEPSIRENAERDILPWNIPVAPYLHGAEASDTRASVGDADLRRFPPAFVAFGGGEMFRDPIRRFVQRLKSSDVDTTTIEEPGMFHVFPILMPWADASHRVYRTVGAFVQARLGISAPRASSGTRDPASARSGELAALGASTA